MIARIEAALRGTLFAGPFHHFASIGSTNQRALEDARAGAEPGAVYIADEQTVGRGRGGHTWHSRAGEGLYLSVLIRPTLDAGDALKLSLATGIAAQAAIANVAGLAIDLRWPNDLVVAQVSRPSRKCGGILTEAALDAKGRLRFAVIGIGINLNHETMPDDLTATATSLRLETGQTVDREQLVIPLLRDLSVRILQVQEAPSSILSSFEECSTWSRGKRVHVAEDEGYTGVTDGLSATGLLRVRLNDGSVREVRHGGVREAEGS